MNKRFREKKVDELFRVVSGDYHATKELDLGETPLISCGRENNGLVGFFDIPEEKTYSHCITVAYNGLPLTTKFHPYRFGAKDDVAVLIPRDELRDTTLFYVAVSLDRQSWRYSYGRKCFREKLRRVSLQLPVVSFTGRRECLDEDCIAELFPRQLHSFIPAKNQSPLVIPSCEWRSFNILSLFDVRRGDFHSISGLDVGNQMTVSRVSEDNGVVGYFDPPEGAQLYPRGYITVSTVGGDAFVQLDSFIATDNVLILVPKTPLLVSTLFFVVFALNHQKWRYSYGRQCYLTKFGRVKLYLPVTQQGKLDEDVIQDIVENTSYWPTIRRRFSHMEKGRGNPITPFSRGRLNPMQDLFACPQLNALKVREQLKKTALTRRNKRK